MDPVKWLWDLVAAAVEGSAGEVTGIVTNFLFSTRDVLDGGRPFTEGSVVARLPTNGRRPLVPPRPLAAYYPPLMKSMAEP